MTERIIKEDIRLALVVFNRDADECVLTRFATPERVADVLAELVDYPSWEVRETYLADRHGNRIW